MSSRALIPAPAVQMAMGGINRREFELVKRTPLGTRSVTSMCAKSYGGSLASGITAAPNASMPGRCPAEWRRMWRLLFADPVSSHCSLLHVTYVLDSPLRVFCHRSDRVTEAAMSADLLDVVRRCRGGESDAWRALLPTFQEIGRRALRSFRLSR